MTKKKANQQSENTKPSKAPNEIATDNAVSEKINSLKSLNSMLLKETVERRQQVETLTQANNSLQSELNSVASDIASLQSELNRLSEREHELEIEKGVQTRFVSVKRAEMEEKIGRLERDLYRAMEEKRAVEEVKNEKELEIVSLNNRVNALEGEIGEEKFIMSRVSEERDAIRAQLEERIQIENVLSSKLAEAEEKETVAVEESIKMKADYDKLLMEKTTVERKMDLLLREKESADRIVVESNRVIEDLKRDVNKITKEKMMIADDRDLQEKKKNELQTSVDGLNELVSKLQQGRTQLVEKIDLLENKCAMNTEREAKMSMEIDVLVKEKHEVEAGMLQLTQEKSSVSNDLNDALKNLRKQNLTIGQLVTEKVMIYKAKNERESQIIKLKEESEELKNRVKDLEKLSTDQTCNIKTLESENSHYRAGLDQSAKERDSARVTLDGERIKVKELTANISIAEKKTEDLQKKLSKLQKGTEKLVAEKKDLEHTCGKLENEILAVKKSLDKTRKEHDDTKAKLTLSEVNTSGILKILKNIGVDQETELGEAIKKSFKDKEIVIEEMKKEVEMLNVCVAKADKGKSFWTMVSSATTIFAAVSLACIARRGY